MTRLRHWIDRHYRLAIFLCVLAIALRAIVPAGYMLGAQGKTITAYICGEGVMAKAVAIPMKPNLLKSGIPANGEAAHKAAPCAFAAMAWAMPDVPLVGSDDRAMPSTIAPHTKQSIARIGHGLAAPPPPKTGPPTIL